MKTNFGMAGIEHAVNNIQDKQDMLKGEIDIVHHKINRMENNLDIMFINIETIIEKLGDAITIHSSSDFGSKK